MLNNLLFSHLRTFSVKGVETNKIIDFIYSGHNNTRKHTISLETLFTKPEDREPFIELCLMIANNVVTGKSRM